MDKDKIKSRAFRIELYPDTTSYDCYSVMKYIQKNYDCVWCFHDKDVWDEDTEDHKKGDLKKFHYHFVIRYSGCPRYIGGISKEIGVAKQFILPVFGDDNSRNNLKYSLTYLVHLHELEKYQYPLSDVKGSGKLKKLFLLYAGGDRNYSDEEFWFLFKDWVSKNRYISTSALIEYFCTEGVLKQGNKYRGYVTRMIDEHNFHYSYKDYD